MGIINLKNGHIRIIQKYTTFKPKFFNISNQNNKNTDKNKKQSKIKTVHHFIYYRYNWSSAFQYVMTI